MIRIDRPWGAELAAVVIIGAIALSMALGAVFHRPLGAWLCLALMVGVQVAAFWFAFGSRRWTIGALSSLLGLAAADAVVLARFGEFSVAASKWLLPASVALSVIGALVGARRGATDQAPVRDA